MRLRDKPSSNPERILMKICTIIGARPQFIKAAAVSRAIAEHNRFSNNSAPLTPHPLSVTEVIIHTGQHYDDGMSAIFFRELEIPEPRYNIGIGSGSHGKQTGEMLAAIEKILISETPDWVLVYGDTNSTLAGALAAAKLHVPVIHVEAGLRSFNRRMPEEINRVITDHLSTLLFCPSQVSADNLVSEGISKGISIVGDVMADALQFAAAKVAKNVDIFHRLNIERKGYCLATIHRAENTDEPGRLNSIISALLKLVESVPVVLPLHPRTKKILEATHPALLTPDAALKIIDPLGYFDIIALEQSSRMIFTDSGGMQKEAYWLKVPCITLRDETEWVETAESGWNIIAGANYEKIIDAALSFNSPAQHPPLYGGDGYAAKRILDVLTKESTAL